MTPYTVSPLNNNKLATVQGESAFAEAVGSSGICQWIGRVHPTKHQVVGAQSSFPAGDSAVASEPAPAFRPQSGASGKHCPVQSPTDQRGFVEVRSPVEKSQHTNGQENISLDTLERVRGIVPTSLHSPEARCQKVPSSVPAFSSWRK